MSDDYNFWLKDHTIVSPVNSNEGLHSSLRDRLVRFKRATKAVNRSISMIKYSIALVLWERRLIPDSLMMTLSPQSNLLRMKILDLNIADLTIEFY
ncbi:hypothetical protein YN1HA_4920 [Sulfurisphaera ohwakuensis]